MPRNRRKLIGFKSVNEAASELAISIRTLWRWIDEEHISTVPNATYVSEDDIERLKLKHRSEGKK